MIEHVAAHPKPFLPVIQEFQDLIESDSALYMLFHSMFKEIPPKYKDPVRPHHSEQLPKWKKVQDYIHMLELFNYILTQAPEFNDSGMVGVPVNAILDWPMGTRSGNAAFLNPKVNSMFKKMLDEWARFLGSSDSTSVLNDKKDGWFNGHALEAMKRAARGSETWKFEDEYICDPKAPHYGFKSWDDFFIRQFRNGVRPIAYEDDDNVIVNACESAPYAIFHHVKVMDKFWVKEQPYSLEHMLYHDSLTRNFVDGTVYQAFLSATSYHRWHAPLSGKIAKVTMAPGTYFSESQIYDFPHLDPDAPDASQGYIVAVATRTLVFIEADNPKIGLLCIVFVGMADVSTCDVRVYEGQHVKKGEEIGMFHFGGSTYCLVFRPGVKLDFDLHGQEKKLGIQAENIQLNKRLATVL
jgi:phosphatidylserine decarboxylase